MGVVIWRWFIVFVVVFYVRFLVGSSEMSWFCVVVDFYFFMVSGMVEVGVDGVFVDIVMGVGMELFVVFMFSDVYGVCVGLMVSIDFNVSVVEFSVRRI